jgi:hypothetical protein
MSIGYDQRAMPVISHKHVERGVEGLHYFILLHRDSGL